MTRTAKFAIIGAGILTGLTLGGGQVAWAGSLYGGWNYAIDSFNDGTEGNTVGKNSKFEFYGLAMKQTADKVYFAVNSNLSLSGYASNGTLNGSIAYGDLFLNFANPSSVQAANGNLYAIRFNDINDSGYNTSGQKVNNINLGLYSNVTGNGLMGKNSGYTNLQAHRNKVGTNNASFGDLGATTAYFNQDNGKASTLNNTAVGYTNIQSGTFLGGVEMVSDLSSLGLDFGHFGATGTQTFGFSVDRDLLPDGDFMAHLFAECDNDGVALAGSIDVPEPSSVLGLVILGLVGAGVRRCKFDKNEAE